jgi:Zn-dependent protease
MNGNIKVGNLFGIPFYINPSWFFVLGLMTLTFGTDLAVAYQTQLTGIYPWLLALITSLLLFASVLAHELGHSFVAISQGIEVKSITLFIFGGLAALDKESETPEQSFLVAIAGPVVSLILFTLLTILYFNLPLPSLWQNIVQLLAYINLVLAMFNMIPGLPLDGGNVLKAIVWKATGNPQKGIIWAGRVGQVFGWTAIFIGILGTLGLLSYGSFWTILIGWFLLQNAGTAAQSATIEDKLKKYFAGDAISEESPIIPDNLTLRKFVNEYVIGKQSWRKFLVINEEGKLIGLLHVDDLRSIPTSQWNEIYVSDLMKSTEEVKTVNDTVPLLEVIKLLEQQKELELTVVKENGVVVGLIEKKGIIKFLQSNLTTA